jgi:hypothetical protein
MLKSLSCAAACLLLACGVSADVGITETTSDIVFDVQATRTGKLNSRAMVLSFDSITVASSSGDLAYAETEPGTAYTALDFQRSWPQNFVIGTGGDGWPGGGFLQFGFVSFDYQSRSTLTAELEGLWFFPFGHPRELEPALAVMTMVIHGNGDVEMSVLVDSPESP